MNGTFCKSVEEYFKIMRKSPRNDLPKKNLKKQINKICLNESQDNAP